MRAVGGYGEASEREVRRVILSCKRSPPPEPSVSRLFAEVAPSPSSGACSCINIFAAVGRTSRDKMQEREQTVFGLSSRLSEDGERTSGQPKHLQQVGSIKA